MRLLLFIFLLSPPIISFAQQPVFTGEKTTWHEGFDRYDYIGMAIVVCLIALWIAHFVMPDTGPAAPV